MVAHRVSQLCLIHMLLLQQFCSSLLDQVSGVEVHSAMLLEPDELISQLVAPLTTKNVVYDGIALHASPVQLNLQVAHCVHWQCHFAMSCLGLRAVSDSHKLQVKLMSGTVPKAACKQGLRVCMSATKLAGHANI